MSEYLPQTSFKGRHRLFAFQRAANELPNLHNRVAKLERSLLLVGIVLRSDHGNLLKVGNDGPEEHLGHVLLA